MSDQDQDLRDLTSGLASLDLDPARAAAIGRAGRDQLGRGPEGWLTARALEPLAVGAVSASYLIWALLRALDGWR
jgi:hypothetical protein